MKYIKYYRNVNFKGEHNVGLSWATFVGYYTQGQASSGKIMKEVYEKEKGDDILRFTVSVTKRKDIDIIIPAAGFTIEYNDESEFKFWVTLKGNKRKIPLITFINQMATYQMPQWKPLNLKEDRITGWYVSALKFTDIIKED